MQSEPSSQDEPSGLCQCGHTSRTHSTAMPESFCTYAGCHCSAFRAQPVPTIINDRCRCSHDRFRHNYDTADGPCSKPDCDCKKYAPVTVETVELPEPEHTLCRYGEHEFNPFQGYRDEPGKPHCLTCGHVWGECSWHQGDVGAPAELPESKELCECPDREVVGIDLANPKFEWSRCRNCGRMHMARAAQPPPPEGPERPPCVCEHSESHHRFETRSCLIDDCPCEAYRPDRPEPDACAACGSPDSWVDRSICAEPCGGMHDRCANCGEVLGYCALENPPQPERRPPLSVAYSVAGGHAYEVSIPGDASVTALDGALIITHPDAQVLAITRVAPIKES